MNTKIPVLIQLVEHVQCNGNNGYFHDNHPGSQYPLCPMAYCAKCSWSGNKITPIKTIVLQALKDE